MKKLSEIMVFVLGSKVVAYIFGIRWKMKPMFRSGRIVNIHSGLINRGSVESSPMDQENDESVYALCNLEGQVRKMPAGRELHFFASSKEACNYGSPQTDTVRRFIPARTIRKDEEKENYSERDMIDFAQWWYGPDSESVANEPTLTTEKGFAHWKKYVKK